MSRKTPVLLTLAVMFPCLAAYAFMTYSDHGNWPGDWPEELEPLRESAQTFSGPIVTEVYEIPFAARESFEAAWPHLLNAKIRNRYKYIRLVSGPQEWSGPLDGFAIEAGVRIVENPWRAKGPPFSAITLIVDGKIVDLNRIPFPRDIPIIDDRFPPVELSVGEEDIQDKPETAGE